jgi:hypothetical protein
MVMTVLGTTLMASSAHSPMTKLPCSDTVRSKFFYESEEEDAKTQKTRLVKMRPVDLFSR